MCECFEESTELPEVPVKEQQVSRVMRTYFFTVFIEPYIILHSPPFLPPPLLPSGTCFALPSQASCSYMKRHTEKLKLHIQTFMEAKIKQKIRNFKVPVEGKGRAFSSNHFHRLFTLENLGRDSLLSMGD